MDKDDFFTRMEKSILEIDLKIKNKDLANIFI